LERTPHEQFRRPRRERDRAAWLQHAEHLRNGYVRSRRKHVTVLAQDDVEGGVGEGKRFDITFVPLDLDAADSCVLSRTLQQLRREVEAGHGRARPARGECGDTGAAADVEHAVPGTNARVTDEARGWRRRHHLQRHEVRPALLLRFLELCECVHQDLHVRRGKREYLT